MSLAESILLGVLQGLTEFLPVSSSGHLVALKELMGIHSPAALVEVALHCGTLLAILVVFGKDVTSLAVDGLRGIGLLTTGKSLRNIVEKAPLFPTAVAVAVGTVPVAAAALLFGEQITSLFQNLRLSGACIFVTGLIVLASRYAPPGRAETVSPARGAAIGLSQACALLPGISRSGSTIVAGVFLGLKREEAARFSFLLAVPALVGAAVWEVLSISSGEVPDAHQGIEAGVLFGGVLASALVGTVCLVLLMRIIKHGKLHWFAAYCLPVGAALFLISFFR